MRLSDLPRFADELTDILPTLTLTLVSNASSDRTLVTYPSKFSWDPSLVEVAPQYMAMSTKAEADETILVQFVPSGTAAKFVDFGSVEQMTMIVRVHPQLHVQVCSLPTTLYPGAVNTFYCNITAPRASGLTASLSLGGSVESAYLSDSRLDWDGTSVNRTFAITGKLTTNSPFQLWVSVEGTNINPTPIYGNRDVLVRPLEQVSLRPVKTRYIVYIGENLTLWFVPSSSTVICHASPNAVNVTHNPNNYVILTGVRPETAVAVLCTLDPSSPSSTTSLAPPVFYVLSRNKKKIDRQSVRGYVQQLDTFIDVQAPLEVFVSELPDETSLAVMPTADDTSSFITFPSSFAFTTNSPKSVMFNFIGTAELLAIPLYLKLFGAIHEYDTTSLDGLSISVRQRVDFTVVEAEPVLTVSSQQWIENRNRQTLTIRLLNRTSDYVVVTPIYDGPEDAVLFDPELISFYPVYTGTESIQARALEIVGLKPADPAEIRIVATGPDEFNWRSVSLGKVQFLPLRQTLTERENFVDQIFVGSANARRLIIGLNERPDIAGKDVLIEVVPTSGALVAEPPQLRWVVGGNDSLTKSVTLTGYQPDAITVSIQQSTEDVRYNYTLPLPSFSVRVRSLLKLLVLVEGKVVTDSINLFVGDHAKQTVTVQIQELPISSESVVSVDPTCVETSIVAMTVMSADGITIYFGATYNNGATTAQIQLVGVARASTDTSTIPRQTRILLPIAGPTEYDLASTPDITVNVVDNVGYVLKGFNNSITRSQTTENALTFTIKPKEPPTYGALHLKIDNCIALDGSTTNGTSWQVGETHEATITLVATSVTSSCFFRIVVDESKANEVKYARVALDTYIKVSDLPSVVILSDPVTTESDVRYKGFDVRVSLTGGTFQPQLTTGTMSSNADVRLLATTPTDKEKYSFNASIAANSSEFVSASVDTTGTIATIHFHPLSTFRSSSVETVAITFTRTSLMQPSSFRTSTVYIFLQVEALSMFGTTERVYVDQIISALSLVDGVASVGMPQLAARVRTLVNLPECISWDVLKEEERGRVLWSNRLLPLTVFGDDAFGVHTSIVVGNAVGVIMLLLLHLVFALLVHTVRRYRSYSDKTFRAAMGRVRCPSVVLLLVFFYLQPSMSSAIYVTLYSPSLALRSICGMFFLGMGFGLPALLLVRLYLSWNCKYVPRRKKAADQKEHNRRLKAIFLPNGTWTDTSSPLTIQRLGHIFVDYRETCQWYSVVDAVFGVALGVVDGMRLDTAPLCKTKNSLVLVVVLAQLFVFSWLRPFNVNFLNYYGMMQRFLECVIVVCVLVGAENSSDVNKNALIAAAFCVLNTILMLATKLFADCVLEFVTLFQLSHMFVSRRKFVAEQAEDEQEFVEIESPNSAPLLTGPAVEDRLLPVKTIPIQNRLAQETTSSITVEANRAAIQRFHEMSNARAFEMRELAADTSVAVMHPPAALQQPSMQGSNPLQKLRNEQVQASLIFAQFDRSREQRKQNETTASFMSDDEMASADAGLVGLLRSDSPAGSASPGLMAGSLNNPQVRHAPNAALYTTKRMLESVSGASVDNSKAARLSWLPPDQQELFDEL